jgi:hypothetical protein
MRLDPQIPTQIETLREQLAQQLARRGPDDPFVEHLRWQIAGLERQLRRLDGADGVSDRASSTGMSREPGTPLA